MSSTIIIIYTYIYIYSITRLIISAIARWEDGPASAHAKAKSNSVLLSFCLDLCQCTQDALQVAVLRLLLLVLLGLRVDSDRA